MKNHIINIVTGNGSNKENTIAVLFGVALTIFFVLTMGHSPKY